MKYLPNILIVDDSELYLIFLKNLICKFEVNLITALSGVEALEKIHEVELALAIIDAQMFEMNGYELAMKINERKPYLKVPIIFLSLSDVNQTELLKGYSCGAVDFLLKSTDDSVLICKISAFIELFNQRQTMIENAAILNNRTNELMDHDNTERKLAEESLLLENAILRTQQNLSTDGILVMNEKEEIISYNQRFIDMWNFPFDVAESNSDEFVIEWITDKLANPEEFSFLKNNPYEVKDEICKDEVLLKDARIFERYSAPMLNKDKYFGRVWSFQDITERNLAESRLKISEEKYETILNASPDGILLIDLNGIISEVSVIGFELFGAENRDDLIGKRIFRFVYDIKTSNIRKLVEKIIDEGLVQNIELKLRKINNTFFTAETSATLIQDSDGEPLSFIIMIRDISQRKKMETKQIHADQMANLGEMASGMAHEINQPLNIISMAMDKLLFDATKKGAIDFEFLKNKSDKIFENIFRIRNIIDHVKAFSRSHDDYVSTAFDVNASIENAISMIKEQFNYIGINLNLQLDKQIPQIFGNTYAFEQVIINLLVNAKDAVIEKKNKQENYSEMIIEIISYQENKFLIIEVVDNGIGINKEDINNVLLPFYTTKDEGKGTGIGLSICYQIIKEMNGTIDIESDGIQGTKIKLVLDIQK